MRFSIDTSDMLKLEKGLKHLGDTGMNRVLYRAQNATGGTGRTIVKNTLSKETSLPISRVHSRIKVKKAHKGKTNFHMMIRDRHVNLHEFKGFGYKRKATRATVWGKTQVYNNTFIVRFSNGHQAIVKHQAGRTKNGGQKIKILYGPALPKEYARGQSQTLWNANVKVKHPKNVARFTALEAKIIKGKYGL